MADIAVGKVFYRRQVGTATEQQVFRSDRKKNKDVRHKRKAGKRWLLPC
jgi:hypothetical protein